MSVDDDLRLWKLQADRLKTVLHGDTDAMFMAIGDCHDWTQQLLVMQCLYLSTVSSRKSGKMTAALAMKVVKRLGQYPQDVVREACAVYLERRDYVDGKGERWLIGIARNMAKEDAAVLRVTRRQNEACYERRLF